MCFPNTTPTKEPWINLPYKFDGTCSRFWRFVNQVCLVQCLIIWLYLHCYPNDLAQVKPIGALLLSRTLTCFATLLECWSPHYLTILKHSLKFFLPFKKTQIRSAPPLVNCDPFMKDHNQLHCMHSISTIGMWHFLGQGCIHGPIPI